MSFIRLQFALLWAARMIWAVIGFALLLITTAFGFGEWLQSEAQRNFVAWLLLLIHMLAMMAVMLVQNAAKYEYFVALKQTRGIQRAQIVVFLCAQIPLILLEGGILGMTSGNWAQTGGICAIMLLFCGVCGQAVFYQLQKYLLALSITRRLALLLVASGPWLLTAWILGMTAGNIICSPQANLRMCLLPIVGLLGLGFFQGWLGRRI